MPLTPEGASADSPAAAAGAARDLARARLGATRLLELRRPDEALRMLGPALAAQPESAPLLGLAAQAHLVKDEPSRALDLAHRAVAADPESEWAWRLTSVAQGRLGLLRASGDSAARAVALEPHLHLPHVQYARALSRMPGGDREAWVQAQHAVRLAPLEPDVHLLVAGLAHPVDRTPSRRSLRTAEAALRRALELDPGNSTAVHELARLQLRRRRGLRAVAGFSRVLSMDPHNDTALGNVVVVLTVWLRRASLLVWFAAVFLFLGAETVDPLLARRVVAAVVVASLGVAVLRIEGTLRGKGPAFGRAFARLGPWATAWAGCTGLATVCLLLAAVVPERLGSAAVVGAVLFNLAAMTCNHFWLSRRR